MFFQRYADTPGMTGKNAEIAPHIVTINAYNQAIEFMGDELRDLLDRWGGLELARIALPDDVAARCATSAIEGPDRSGPPRDLHTPNPS